MTPQLVTPSWISMMSTEHREIKATRHLDHNIRSKTSLPYRHQGHVSSNMVEQQLMVQRQLFRQICACLKPSWKISQGTCQARSNVWSLNEAGEAVCSSQSWLLQGLCKHQIKQSPDKAHRETMRLNPRSSLGTYGTNPTTPPKTPKRWRGTRPRPRSQKHFCETCIPYPSAILEASSSLGPSDQFLPSLPSFPEPSPQGKAG